MSDIQPGTHHMGLALALFGLIQAAHFHAAFEGGTRSGRVMCAWAHGGEKPLAAPNCIANVGDCLGKAAAP